MFLALDLCNSSAGLRAILIVKTILQIAVYILPVIVIITVIASLFKAITSGKDDDLKDTFKLGIRKIIACFVVMFLPTLISYFTQELADENFSLAVCLESATQSRIDALKAKEDAEEEAANKAQEKEDEALLRKAYEEEQKKNKAKKQSYEEWKKEREQNNQNNNGSNNGTNNGNNGSGEIINSGTSGSYFAPLQGANYTITGASVTAGCSNSGAVKHDARVAVGTKIYAAFDGTVQYIQNTCGNQLYSYGNQARLTDPNTNTFIIYAHLNAFEGIETPGIVTCPKNGSSDGPCPYQQCPTSIKKNVIKTKTVKKGEVIGYTGDTGNSISPHLHVEIHENGSGACVTDPWSAFGMH